MSDRPPFDLVKASFYLVAGVIALYGLVVMIGTVFCFLNWNATVDGEAVCGKGQLTELLAAALAAALAFAGGRMAGNRNGAPPTPSPPPSEEEPP